MLSYIKRKLSESDSTTNSNPDSQLVRKTSQMSLGTGASSEADNVIAIGEDALLHELGYKNANDLQETVYGKFYGMFCFHSDLNVFEAVYFCFF